MEVSGQLYSLLIFICGKRNYDAHSRVELGSHIYSTSHTSKLNSQLSGHIYEVQAKVAWLATWSTTSMWIYCDLVQWVLL